MRDIKELINKITLNKEKLVEVRRNLRDPINIPYLEHLLRQVEGFLAYLEKEFKQLAKELEED
jgi:hypothetical protein